MRTGLYNKTKALVVVIIAIIAVMGIAAIGVAFSDNSTPTQMSAPAQDLTAQVADVRDDAKVITISNIKFLDSTIVNGQKVYDGKNTIALSSKYDREPSFEDTSVSVSSIICTMSSADVGTVTLDYTAVLTGDEAANYTCVIDTTTTTNKIEVVPAKLTLTGVKAESFTYNQSASVKLSGGVLNGVAESDKGKVDFDLDATGTAAGVNAGTHNVVYNATLKGDKANNYVLTTRGAVSVTIKKAPLNIDWGNLTFEYDKKQHRPTATFRGLLDGDTVTATAVYNDELEHGINVGSGAGYPVGVKLGGNHAGNYVPIYKQTFVVITPRVATIVFEGGDTFIANVKISDITAKVTNALDGDKVDVSLIYANESKPGRHVAQVVGLNNENYTLPEGNTLTKSYIVNASYIANYASTANKLAIDIIDQVNGFDPDMVFYVKNIDESKASFDKLKKEEKFFASYKVSMTLKGEPIELNKDQSYKYALTIPATAKEAKNIKLALYDGTTTKVLDLEVIDGKVTFDATNLLELSVAIVYAPIFVWLWAVLGILAVVAVIVAIWMIIFFMGKRKLLFDPNGGEAVEGISAKYKQEVAVPSPTRDAHVFNGWFKDKKLKKEVKVDKMPFWDTVLVAKWLDADGVPVPYMPGSAILPAARVTLAPVKLDNEIQTQNDTVTRTLTFDVRGGLPIAAQTLLKGAAVQLPIANKSGDAFAGWYLDDKFKAEARISVMPKKSMTVYAKWSSDIQVVTKEPTVIKVDKSDKTKTITFDTRGGNLIESIVAVKRAKIDVAEAVKIGETFAYWSSDSKDLTKKIKLNAMPTVDMTVYAVYSSDLNPVGVAVSEEAKRNETLNAPIERSPYNPQEFTRSVGVPSAVDDKIDALMFGRAVMPSTRPLVDRARQEAEAQPKPQSQPIVEQSRPTVEVTKKAVIQTVDTREDKQSLQDKLLVKALLFNVRGGVGMKPLQAKIGVPIELPTPIKGESKFLGWYKDESLLKPIDFNKMPNKNTMLFAKWVEDATVQELFDSGLAEGGKNNQAFDDDQAHIDKMFALDNKGLDDIVIQRSTSKKSSMIVDDSKKKSGK